MKVGDKIMVIAKECDFLLNKVYYILGISEYFYHIAENKNYFMAIYFGESQIEKI